MCNEQTQTTGLSGSSVASGESDQGSGTGLLVCTRRRDRSSFPRGLKAHACSVATFTVHPDRTYQEGNGHQSQFTDKCHEGKVDKSVQISVDQGSSLEEEWESDDTYLVPVHIWRPGNDNASLLASNRYLRNSKGVQTKPGHIRGESKPRTQLKRRKVFKKVCREGSPSSEPRSSCLSDETDSAECQTLPRDILTNHSRPKIPPKPTGPKPKRNVWSAPSLPSHQQEDSPNCQTHRRSIASLSELAEVTISPQNATKCSPLSPTPLSQDKEADGGGAIFVMDESVSDDTDWETKSAISL